MYHENISHTAQITNAKLHVINTYNATFSIATVTLFCLTGQFLNKKYT